MRLWRTGALPWKTLRVSHRAPLCPQPPQPNAGSVRQLVRPLGSEARGGAWGAAPCSPINPNGCWGP